MGGALTRPWEVTVNLPNINKNGCQIWVQLNLANIGDKAND